MLRLALLPLFLALALSTLVVSITVTQPDQTTVWGPDGGEVEWSSVSTDQATVDILLVNMNANTASTGSSHTLAQSISTSSGTYTVTSTLLSGIKPGPGYQVNLVNPQNNGILAQSNPFNITSSGSSSGSGASSSSSQASSSAASAASSARLSASSAVSAASNAASAASSAAAAAQGTPSGSAFTNAAGARVIGGGSLEQMVGAAIVGGIVAAVWA